TVYALHMRSEALSPAEGRGGAKTAPGGETRKPHLPLAQKTRLGGGAKTAPHNKQINKIQINNNNPAEIGQTKQMDQDVVAAFLVVEENDYQSNESTTHYGF